MRNSNVILFISLFSLLVTTSCYTQRELPRTNFMNRSFNAIDIQIHDDYAFVEDQHGIVIFDVINPAQPFFIGSMSLVQGELPSIHGSCDLSFTTKFSNIHDIYYIEEDPKIRFQ